MKLRITVDQKTYEVDVEVAEDDRAPAGPAHAYISGGAHRAAIRASAAAARRGAGEQRGRKTKFAAAR